MRAVVDNVAGAIVVSTGLGAPPKTLCTSVAVDPLQALTPVDPQSAPRSWIQRALFDPHPAGSDDNNPIAVGAALKRAKARLAGHTALKERIIQHRSLVPADFVVDVDGTRMRLRPGVKTGASASLMTTSSPRGRAA